MSWNINAKIFHSLQRDLSNFMDEEFTEGSKTWVPPLFQSLLVLQNGYTWRIVLGQYHYVLALFSQASLHTQGCQDTGLKPIGAAVLIVFQF